MAEMAQEIKTAIEDIAKILSDKRAKDERAISDILLAIYYAGRFDGLMEAIRKYGHLP